MLHGGLRYSCGEKQTSGEFRIAHRCTSLTSITRPHVSSERSDSDITHFCNLWSSSFGDLFQNINTASSDNLLPHISTTNITQESDSTRKLNVYIWPRHVSRRPQAGKQRTPHTSIDNALTSSP